MRFSVTFPGTAEQAIYMQDLIALMGEMRDGIRPTDEQLDRFRGLEALTNIEAEFPCFDPDGYAITHDQVSGEISVYPAHHSAETDAEGFAYALRSMLGAFDRHEDIVTFGYAVTGDKPYAGAYSGGAVVCTSYAWEITTTEDAENQLRKHAEQLIDDARIRALSEAQFGSDDDDMSPS